MLINLPGNLACGRVAVCISMRRFSRYSLDTAAALCWLHTSVN